VFVEPRSVETFNVENCPLKDEMDEVAIVE
jgi:hypothetical protein